PPFTHYYVGCGSNTGRRAPGFGKADTIGSRGMADKGFRAHLQFPSTRWELLADASVRDEQSPAALNEFPNRYYAAVRAYIAAVARNPVDADDLTQHFFETVVLSGRLLTRADRQKGSFRPYLKQSIRNFLIDEHRRQTRSVNPDVRPDTLDEGWNAIP